jgi:hypothetical protein
MSGLYLAGVTERTPYNVEAVPAPSFTLPGILHLPEAIGYAERQAGNIGSVLA